MKAVNLSVFIGMVVILAYSEKGRGEVTMSDHEGSGDHEDQVAEEVTNFVTRGVVNITNTPSMDKFTREDEDQEEEEYGVKKAGRMANRVESTYSGYHYYWKEIVISKSNLITTFPFMGKTYKVAFDLEIASDGSSGASVIHFTTGGDDGGVYGQRAPAVWTWNYKGEDIFHISSAIDGNWNYWHNVPINPSYPSYHHIEISQSLYHNKYWYNIAINHVSVFTVENTDAKKFDNVEMWAGDPVRWGDPALNGTLRNVCVDI